MVAHAPNVEHLLGESMREDKLSKLADYMDSRRGSSSESDRLRTAEENASTGSRVIHLNAGIDFQKIATKKQKFSELQFGGEDLFPERKTRRTGQIEQLIRNKDLVERVLDRLTDRNSADESEIRSSLHSALSDALRHGENINQVASQIVSDIADEIESSSDEENIGFDELEDFGSETESHSDDFSLEGGWDDPDDDIYASSKLKSKKNAQVQHGQLPLLTEQEIEQYIAAFVDPSKADQFRSAMYSRVGPGGNTNDIGTQRDIRAVRAKLLQLSPQTQTASPMSTNATEPMTDAVVPQEGPRTDVGPMTDAGPAMMSPNISSPTETSPVGAPVAPPRTPLMGPVSPQTNDLTPSEKAATLEIQGGGEWLKTLEGITDPVEKSNLIEQLRQYLRSMGKISDNYIKITKTSQIGDIFGDHKNLFDKDSFDEEIGGETKSRGGIPDLPVEIRNLSDIDPQEGYDDYEDYDDFDDDVIEIPEPEEIGGNEVKGGIPEFPIEMRNLLDIEPQEEYDDDDDINYDEDFRRDMFSNSKFKFVKLSQFDDEDSGIDDHHVHEWGPVEESRLTGNPHRKCKHCKMITLDLSDDDSSDELDDDTFDDIDYSDNPECEYCSGEMQKLGRLGNLDWYRCRDCGAESSKESY